MGRDPEITDADSAAMRERWRVLARENAMHYVATRRNEWDAGAFYASGAGTVASALEWAGPQIGRRRALEIGCGAGRMLPHLAAEFDEVHAVDIADEMLDLARSNVDADNVSLHRVSGAGLDGLDVSGFDFVFSFLVFQHVPYPSAVAAYIKDAAAALAPGGRAVLHFDTRRRPLPARLAMRLPDRLLPRHRRGGIRRNPLPAEWPGAACEQAGLRVVDERKSASASHLVLAERPR